MRLVPRETARAITFFETHAPQWLDHAAEIGTDPAAVADLQAKAQAARAAFRAQAEAQQAARSATGNLRLAMEALTGAGAAIVQQIRAKARTGGHNVFSLALIPPPAEAGPIGAPGTPTNFSARLRQDGTLVLNWDCPNPRGAAGTIYQVSRRIGAWDGTGADGTRPFAHIGSSGVKQFVDATVPAGAAQVHYRVVAMRSTKRGAVAQFTVSLGVSGGSAGAGMLGSSGGGGGALASNVLQTRRVAA